MSANLDTTNGVTSFVSARLDAWHRLGEVATSAMTAEEALRLGHLANWRLRKVPLLAALERGTLEIPDQYAVIRNNPVIEDQEDLLGIVGDRYSILQNEELCELLNAVSEESGAHFETAGAIDGGRRVFVTMKVPSTMRIGGVDRIDTYLAIVTSHDGSTATTLMATPTRIVCQNTLNIALHNATGIIKVRHTSGAQQVIRREAQKALDISFAYLDDFKVQADQLVETAMTLSEFEQIIQAEFGAPEDAAPATITRCQNKIETMTGLFADANTQEEIRNTAWAGFNALTEYYDHFSPVKANGKDDELVRSTRAVFDPGFKTRALELMLQAA